MCQAYEGEHAYVVAREHFGRVQAYRLKARRDKAQGIYGAPYSATETYEPWREYFEAYHREWHNPTPGEILFASNLSEHRTGGDE